MLKQTKEREDCSLYYAILNSRGYIDARFLLRQAWRIFLRTLTSATVHDRMPLILREEDFAAWLDVGTNQRTVDALLRPYSAAEMECYPVSTAVNNVRNE